MRCLPVVSRPNSSNAALEYQQESSTPIGTSSSGADSFDSMKERRALTDDQRADASRLKAVFKSRQQEAKADGRSLTQEDVAVLCEWSGQSAFGQYVRGGVPLNLVAVLKLARALNCKPADISPSLANNIWIDEYDTSGTIVPPKEHSVSSSGVVTSLSDDQNVAPIKDSGRSPRKYPLISWVAAGSWQESCDNFAPGHADEWIESPENAGAHGYWLEVKGPSMLTDFAEGSRILVKPEGFDLVSGRLYIARLKDTGETTFKQYLRDSGNGYLQPLNTAFPVMPITENVEIIGEVIDGKMKPSLFR